MAAAFFAVIAILIWALTARGGLGMRLMPASLEIMKALHAFSVKSSVTWGLSNLGFKIK